MLRLPDVVGSALFLEAGPSSLHAVGVCWAALLFDARLGPASVVFAIGREVEAAKAEADVVAALARVVVMPRPLTVFDA